jgi:hypothetical protein
VEHYQSIALFVQIVYRLPRFRWGSSFSAGQDNIIVLHTPSHNRLVSRRQTRKAVIYCAPSYRAEPVSNTHKNQLLHHARSSRIKTSLTDTLLGRRNAKLRVVTLRSVKMMEWRTMSVTGNVRRFAVYINTHLTHQTTEYRASAGQACLKILVGWKNADI